MAPPASPAGRWAVTRDGTGRRQWLGLDLRWWGLIAAAGVVFVGVTSAGGSSHTVDGVQSVYDTDYYAVDDGDPCSGHGGYSDMHAGARVEVEDADREVVATTELRGGHVQGAECVFGFTAEDVPSSDGYWISIGSRNPVYFTRAEMEDADWQPGLSLGG